jgi:hypothetical protein
MGVIITINGVITGKRVIQGVSVSVPMIQAALDIEKAATPGFNYQIFVDENDPAFVASVVPPTQDELDAQAARQYQKLVALKNMTPAQIQTFVDNNVVDLPSARDAIKTLAIAVGILARRI